MNPNGLERRQRAIGRRCDDVHCMDHSGMQANIEHLKVASQKHGNLLEKIAAKTDRVLISCVLLLIGVIFDLIIRFT